jgi:hypothetical protein
MRRRTVGRQISPDNLDCRGDVNTKIENYNSSCMRARLTELELEILTIRKYVRKTKSDRYAQFVSKPRSRTKFIARLAHFKDLDFGKFRRLDNNEADQIREIARRAKFDVCYVISENRRIDARVIEVENAINDTIGHSMGTLLVFGLAEIVYYEGEEMGDRWVSI